MNFQQGTSQSFDTQGQPYVTLVWRGVCDPASVKDSSGYTEVQSAWAGFWGIFSRETAGAKTVEWRSPPVFERAEDGTPTVRARFSILEGTDG